MEGFDRVTDIMTDFYQTMLGRQEQHTSSIDQEIVQLGQTLSLDQQLQLCQPFTDNDIKQAIFSIPNHKSPGPDGFNMAFIKHVGILLAHWCALQFMSFSKMANCQGFMGKPRL